jgi:hypothetical protein
VIHDPTLAKLERLCRVVAPFGLVIAKHAECDSIADVFLGAHAVDRLMHLAVPEGLFQIGAEELLEGLTDLLEAAHPPAA